MFVLSILIKMRPGKKKKLQNALPKKWTKESYKTVHGDINHIPVIHLYGTQKYIFIWVSTNRNK